MAKVVITLEDKEGDDGNLKVRAEFDPPAEAGEYPTMAQAVAAAIMEELQEQAIPGSVKVNAG